MQARFRHAVHLFVYLAVLGVGFVGAYVFAGAMGAPRPDAVRVAASPPARPEPSPTPVRRSGADRYTLVPEPGRLMPGVAASVHFRLLKPDGAAAGIREGAGGLRFFVVRTDLRHFQVLTPEAAADGGWAAPLTPPTAGTYLACAEFRPADRPDSEHVVATAELRVDGDDVREALPVETRTAYVDDYAVRLDGDPAAGVDSVLTFTMSRDGRPITDLQPRQASFGDLVALRQGDLAYVRTTPEPAPVGSLLGGPEVRFHVAFPEPGTYRLFLDLQRVNGRLRVYPFTLTVPARPQ